MKKTNIHADEIKSFWIFLKISLTIKRFRYKLNIDLQTLLTPGKVSIYVIINGYIGF